MALTRTSDSPGASRGAFAWVLLLGLALAACQSAGGNSPLRVEGLELKLHPSGARFVSGTVINDSDRHITSAQVQISLFDDKNRRVDGMYAVVRDVAARDTVVFREPVQSDYDVRGARVRSVLLANQ